MSVVLLKNNQIFNMLLLVISVAAFTVTLVGGLFALYLKDRLHLILGFSAGAVLGVTFFELIPESLNLTSETFSYSFINTVMALGFISYMLFDRFLGFHYSNDHHQLKNIIVAKSSLGAGSLSLHSFIDGIAIGLAFQVSGALGIIVSTAVLMHDFSDGINTVNYVLKSHGPKKLAVRWLLIDAIAPVLGIVSTLFFTLSATSPASPARPRVG